MKGKDVLEIGCGGGQNTVVLSKWGAKAVGLDVSEKQMEYARKLAESEEARVTFHVGNMEDLNVFRSERFDIVLSSFGIGYVDNLSKTFKEVFRVLRKEGLFVFCDVHPIANRGRMIRHGRRRIWGMSNYSGRRKRVGTWKLEDTEPKTARFRGYHRTIQDWFNLLVTTGFVVERILEPEPYPLGSMTEAEKDKIPYLHDDYVRDYDLWKRIPHTILFKAAKP